MKRDNWEPRDEYDFSGGERGRYYERYRSGEPTFEVVTDEEDRRRVTAALRSPAEAATRSQKHRPVTYAVVYEQSQKNHSAYVPDLPGCVATGRTRAIVERRIRKAIAMHLEGMREDGDPVPVPTTSVGLVEIS